MPSNLAVNANFFSAGTLSAVGISSMASFFDEHGAALDPSMMATAATAFGLAAAADPNNYTNRIYNAVVILLNLINNPALRSQAEAYGVNLDNLLAPNIKFPTNGAPQINDSVDVFAASVLPAVSTALSELSSVPATWTGMVEVTSADMPSLVHDGTPLWIDKGDVTAMKAACEWFKAWVELLKAYSLNVDFYRLPDPVSTTQTPIVVDGLTNDWTGIPASLIGYSGQNKATTQSVFVALDAGSVALLVSGNIPYQSADMSSFGLYIDMDLSTGEAINGDSNYSRSLDVYVGGGYGVVTWVSIWCEGIGYQTLDPSTVALGNGVLEIKIPVMDFLPTTQVTVDEADISGDAVEMNMKFHSSTPISVLRADNPEFLSRVRNSSSLASAKTDLQGAVADYLAADTVIGNRSVPSAALLHLINIDDEGNSRNAFKTLATDIQTSLAGGALNLNVDPDISSSGTEPVYLANFFNAPYVTTNKLPSGLTGTPTHPGWTTFPDPTFNGIFPNMTNAKLDKYLRWDSQPPVAPTTLSGRIANVTDDKGDGWQIYFGANTYVQSGDWHGSNPGEVGSYTYTKTATNTARLVMTCTAPPSSAGSSAVTLTFTSNNHHSGTFVSTDSTGIFSMSLQNDVAPTTVAGMSIQVDSPTGPGQIVYNSNGTWMQVGMGGMEDRGTYTYAKYAPAGAMLVSKDSNNTHYSVLTFDGTDALTINQNSGEMYIVNADGSEFGQGYFQDVANMTVTSSAFANGGPIPATYAYTGLGNSPPLAWKNAPAGTKSYALLAVDLDASFTHWALYNLPAATTSLLPNQGQFATLVNGAIQGVNDYGEADYGGPQPPPGEKHTYAFTVLALDTMLDDSMFYDPSNVHQNDLEYAMDGHVLGFGVLTGTYTGSAMPTVRKLGVVTGK